MGKYPTITELAKTLGVAPSTVSRALQDHPRIGKKTKERIWQKALECRYMPNQYSKVLKDNKTWLIGVIVPDLTLHFYARVLSAIDAHLRGMGYSVILGNSHEELAQEIALVERFLALRVDGVIAALSRESTVVQHFQRIIDQQIPLVFYDRVANFLAATRIVANDYQAAYNATEHLIKTGCKRIAHITASKNLNNSNNRLYGYLDALKAHHMPINEELVFYFEFDHSTINTFLDNTLTRYPDLDGIFVFNDYVANTAMHHLLKKGKKIPEEISLIGFSDEPISSYMNPRLSTVEDVAARMGQEAARALISAIDDEGLPKDKITIEQEVLLKETTRELQLTP